MGNFDRLSVEELSEIVAPDDPAGMSDQATGWSAMDELFGEYREMLDAFVNSTRASWDGEAGEAYFREILRVADAMESTAEVARGNAVGWTNIAASVATNKDGIDVIHREWRGSADESEATREPYDLRARAVMDYTATETEVEAARRLGVPAPLDLPPAPPGGGGDEGAPSSSGGGSGRGEPAPPGGWGPGFEAPPNGGPGSSGSGPRESGPGDGPVLQNPPVPPGGGGPTPVVGPPPSTGPAPGPGLPPGPTPIPRRMPVPPRSGLRPVPGPGSPPRIPPTPPPGGPAPGPRPTPGPGPRTGTPPRVGPRPPVSGPPTPRPTPPRFAPRPSSGPGSPVRPPGIPPSTPHGGPVGGSNPPRVGSPARPPIGAGPRVPGNPSGPGGGGRGGNPTPSRGTGLIGTDGVARNRTARPGPGVRAPRTAFGNAKAPNRSVITGASTPDGHAQSRRERGRRERAHRPEGGDTDFPMPDVYTAPGVIVGATAAPPPHEPGPVLGRRHPADPGMPGERPAERGVTERLSRRPEAAETDSSWECRAETVPGVITPAAKSPFPVHHDPGPLWGGRRRRRG